jgi:hypothetical protein
MEYPKQSPVNDPDSFSIIQRGMFVTVIWTSALPMAVRDGWRKLGERVTGFGEWWLNRPNRAKADWVARRYAELLGLGYF